MQKDVAIIGEQLIKNQTNYKLGFSQNHVQHMVLIILAGLLAEKVEQFSHPPV